MGAHPIYDHSRILQLHKSGVPTSHIARRIGCSRRHVNRVIREQKTNRRAKNAD